MSQDDLEAAAGVSQSSISQWQRGDRGTPNVEHVFRIEQALGLTPGQLLVDAGYVNLPATTAEMIEIDPCLSRNGKDTMQALYGSPSVRRRSKAAGNVTGGRDPQS